ncbi:MAG: hypothetical protein PHF57_07695, partial [Methanoregula sp.]|nr:hypothetical protein [Methanoregula sp.]
TSKFVVFGQPHVSTLSGQGKTPIQTVTAWRLLLAASCSHIRIRRITERDYSRPVFLEPDLKFSLHPARATTTLSGVS